MPGAVSALKEAGISGRQGFLYSMESGPLAKVGRNLAYRFDAWVCRLSGVFPFCELEECLLRLQMGEAPHAIPLPDCTILPGEPVALLHLWNEHLPIIPPNGPTLAWAVRFQRGLVLSLQSAAIWMRADSRFAGARAVGGVWALVPWDERAGGMRLMRRLGFTVFPYHHRLGRFGEFWENLYSWWLLWAYNPASRRHRQLLNLHRSEIWISRQAFLRRYAGEQGEAG